MVKFAAEIFGFLVIIVVIYRYIVPPLRKAMTARQATIGSEFDEARKAKEDAEAAETKYKKSIGRAEQEAAQLRDSARAQSEQILEELGAKAHQEAERIAERGRQQLAAERDRLVRELRTEMGTLAVDLASKIVHDFLADEARRGATVDRFLDDLDRRGSEQPAPVSAST